MRHLDGRCHSTESPFIYKHAYAFIILFDPHTHPMRKQVNYWYSILQVGLLKQGVKSRARMGESKRRVTPSALWDPVFF